ncbi:MAG: hypothetical protein GEU80_06370 [Dehalococcoidia bacterium]|nr:hypothetical protein [Dehalococcoidia bacterium]
MDGFEWASDNLGAAEPHELQRRGVTVFFAPNIERSIKVIDLSDGHVDVFRPEEHMPTAGYFAEFGSLERHCLRLGRPVMETDGFVQLQRSTRRRARDPLRRGQA